MLYSLPSGFCGNIQIRFPFLSTVATLSLNDSPFNTCSLIILILPLLFLSSDCLLPVLPVRRNRYISVPVAPLDLPDGSRAMILHSLLPIVFALATNHLSSSSCPYPAIHIL